MEDLTKKLLRIRGEPCTSLDDWQVHRLLTTDAESSSAYDYMDLLTMDMHERVPVLGLEDLNGEEDSHNLMAESLDTDVRRLPESSLNGDWQDAEITNGDDDGNLAEYDVDTDGSDYTGDGFADWSRLQNSVKLSATSPWVGAFLLHLAQNRADEDPNKDIQVVIPG